MPSRTSIAAAAAVAALCATPHALAQTAAELIDMDRQIAAEKRKQELQRLKEANRPPPPPPPPLVTVERKRSLEEDLRVLAVYGATTSLRALVSFRDDPPVELSLAQEGQSEVAGWRLVALTTQAIEMERIGATPPMRALLRMRFSAPLQTATTPPASSAYLPAPLPAAVLPIVAPPPPQVSAPSPRTSGAGPR